MGVRISAVKMRPAESCILGHTPAGIDCALSAHDIWLKCNTIYNKETVKRRLSDLYNAGSVERTTQAGTRGHVHYIYWRVGAS